MSNGTRTSERATQNRIVKLFQDELGYRYLGNWQDRYGNSNIEVDYLQEFLLDKGYSSSHISKALDTVLPAAKGHGENLYHANQKFYSYLRYGIPVKIEPGLPSETVVLIDWENPATNHFALAEEVTIHGEHEKRPDIVLYVNGIALAVLELKNSRKDLSEGIRQNITNQDEQFIKEFFTTIQLIMAGNDSQGLRYGTIDTPEKYYLAWKEDEQENEGYKLDKYLKKLCKPHRLLELIRDFVLFDGGVKKLPRFHQYFAVKEAQNFVARKEGGIIWHTQGSGKSITMVMLAKWILANYHNARVLIATDRDELDKQIERVFSETGEGISRTRSGNDLMRKLADTTPRLICSLVHKFGQKGEENFDDFIRDLENRPSNTVGDFFVFVDECHRSQSGRLHKAMKAIMPGAVFIGFTGTPLLKKDRSTSLEVFGRYIHTYKFNEAVADGVVLDLAYEARDIDQRITSQQRIDEWFEAKTRGLNDYQKAKLKKKWGTMQKVLSARSRMDTIVMDIVHDFGVKRELNDNSGNAMLVASSIHEACRYYELFQNTPLKNYCAVVTSYNPNIRDIVNEATGENTETEKEYVHNLYTEILKHVDPEPGKSKTEVYEDRAKHLFVNEPATMRLLIVVDKLLTGFDAPACTYLYIDKAMQDHGLFQAICRVNRLNGESKTFGYIIDYKDLFPKVEDAVAVYTSDLDYDHFDKQDVEVLLKDRLEQGREKLDEALEALELLCEGVPEPKEELDYIHFFCGNTEIAGDLKDREQLRHGFYKAVAACVRAYASIADDLQDAGYSDNEIGFLKKRLKYYTDLRQVVRNAASETIDLKSYEADMRHLLDTYIQADQSKKISHFDDMGFMEIVEKTNLEEAIDGLPGGIKKSPEAVAETIENNVRSKIIKEHLLDPAFYDRMSALLSDIITQRRQKAIEYEEYLEKINTLIHQVNRGGTDDTPASCNTPGKRALYNTLEDDKMALEVHENVIRERDADWRGNLSRERIVKGAIYSVVQDEDRTEELFRIIKAQQEY